MPRQAFPDRASEIAEHAAHTGSQSTRDLTSSLLPVTNASFCSSRRSTATRRFSLHRSHASRSISETLPVAALHARDINTATAPTRHMDTPFMPVRSFVQFKHTTLQTRPHNVSLNVRSGCAASPRGLQAAASSPTHTFNKTASAPPAQLRSERCALQQTRRNVFKLSVCAGTVFAGSV